MCEEMMAFECVFEKLMAEMEDRQPEMRMGCDKYLEESLDVGRDMKMCAMGAVKNSDICDSHGGKRREGEMGRDGERERGREGMERDGNNQRERGMEQRGDNMEQRGDNMQRGRDLEMKKEGVMRKGGQGDMKEGKADMKEGKADMRKGGEGDMMKGGDRKGKRMEEMGEEEAYAYCAEFYFNKPDMMKHITETMCQMEDPSRPTRPDGPAGPDFMMLLPVILI